MGHENFFGKIVEWCEICEPVIPSTSVPVPSYFLVLFECLALFRYYGSYCYISLYPGQTYEWIGVVLFDISEIETNGVFVSPTYSSKAHIVFPVSVVEMVYCCAIISLCRYGLCIIHLSWRKLGPTCNSIKYPVGCANPTGYLCCDRLLSYGSFWWGGRKKKGGGKEGEKLGGERHFSLGMSACMTN